MSATRFPAPEPLGDTALLLRWDERIDADVVAQVHSLARALRADAPAWVRDIVPAYASLAVFVDTDALADGSLSMAQAEAWCARVAGSTQATDAAGASRLVEIPVRYGGEDGPDLAHVAAATGLSEQAVVARHAAREYRVAMLGFAPGFPYLLGLDPELATPRRAQPRTRVAAGSVGIGGAQTGLYPRDSPGGWQIIGRTALAVFDALRDEPSLLQPGDRVRFVAQA